MANEYKLSYTASDIDAKLGKIDEIDTDISFLKNYVTPQMFGAKGDGVTDDTEAFLDAIDAIVDNGGGTLYIPVGEYIMTAPITFYCDKMDVVGDGAILNWGSISNTSCACVRVVTHDSYANDDNPEMYHNNIRLGQLHKCSGVIFKGITDYAIRTYGNLIGVNYGGNYATGEMSVGFNFEHCVFYGFDVAVRCDTNSWVQGLIACNISDNNVAIEIPAGGSNYCERVTIIDSNIHSNVVAVKIGYSHAHIHAIGCSFDYNDTICNLSEGRLYLTDCHLESTRNNGNWFSLIGGLLMCKSCEWYASGGDHLGTVGSEAIVHVDGGYFADAGYAPAELFTGTGGIYVRNMFPRSAVNSVITGKSFDILSDVGASMITPKYIDYTTGEFLDSNISISAVQTYIPVEPSAKYRLSTSNLTTGLDVNICFYDANKVYTYDGDSTSSDLNVKAGSHSLLKKTLPVDFVVPDGCYFMRFHSSIKTTIGEWSLVKLTE